MTKKENARVLSIIEYEGFDYTFVGYSTFTEVKDPKFHKLRKAYLKAGKALADYIGADIL